jgi:hypothetical protein
MDDVRIKPIDNHQHFEQCDQIFNRMQFPLKFGNNYLCLSFPRTNQITHVAFIGERDPAIIFVTYFSWFSPSVRFLTCMDGPPILRREITRRILFRWFLTLEDLFILVVFKISLLFSIKIFSYNFKVLFEPSFQM